MNGTFWFGSGDRFLGGRPERREGRGRGLVMSFGSIHRCVPAALLAAGLFVGGLAVAQVDGAAPDAPSTAIDRLAERLLGYWGDPAVSRAELLPGALPEDMPIAFPTPRSADLLGSLAQYEHGRLMHVQAVYDSTLGSDAALAAFGDAFAAMGWLYGTSYESGGFLPAQTSASGQVCDPESGAFIYIYTTSWPDEPSDVRLNASLGAAAYNPPCDIASLTYRPVEGQAPLPPLHAPERSQVHPHSTMQMPDQASSTAMLVSELGASALAEHYATELASEGWILAELDAGADTTNSSWTYTDPEGRTWSAVLTSSTIPWSTVQHAVSFFVAASGG